MSLSLRTLLIALVAPLLFSGCATLSKSECQSGSWFEIGVRDGAVGHGEERFASHAAACARHGLDADRGQWLAGRSQGLNRYCTARSGVEVGRQNGNYAGVCPVELEPSFLNGLRLGQDIALAHAEVARISHEIERIEHQLDPKPRDADDKHNDAKDAPKPLNDRERIALAVQMGYYVAQREDARREVERLEHIAQGI
jgi:Protein of unknown function (DUF2799)